MWPLNAALCSTKLLIIKASMHVDYCNACVNLCSACVHKWRAASSLKIFYGYRRTVLVYYSVLHAVHVADLNPFKCPSSAKLQRIIAFMTLSNLPHIN